MIDLAMWRGPVRDHLVLFATAREVEELRARMTRHDVYRFRHSVDDLSSVDPKASLVRTAANDLTRSEDELLGCMDAKSCRYEIRRGQKIASQIRISSGRDAERDFLALHEEFVSMKRDAPPLSRRRYRVYLPWSDVWVASYDGVPVVGHLLLRDDRLARVRLIFSASRRLVEQYRQIAGPVNRWLHWEEMRSYKARGIATYDFGGIGTEGVGRIGRFKLSFGGEIETGYDLQIAGAAARLPLALHTKARALHGALASRR